MDFLLKIISFLLERKKFWLLPIFLIFFLITISVIVSENSEIVPFIYTLF